MTRVFGNRRALAVAIFGRSQHRLLFVFRHQQRDDLLAVFQIHAAHATRGAAHRTHVVFVEAHRLAGVGKQHDVMLAVGQRSTDQEVALIQVDRDDAGLAWIAEIGQWRLLDGAEAGRHEDVAVVGEAAVFARDRQHDGDFFVVLQREHVDDRLAARIARALRHFPHLKPIQAAAIAEAQDVIVRIGNEQLIDPVVLLGRHGLLATPAALLRAVLGDRLRLHVAGV